MPNLYKTTINIVLRFFLSLISIHSFSQKQEDIMINGSYNNIPLIDFFDILEEQNGLRIFYKTDWIDTMTITQEFDQTLLSQALTRIFRDYNFSYQYFQDNGIAIIPGRSEAIFNIQSGTQAVTIVGDPLNTGKYPSATLTGRIVDGKNGEPLVGAIIYEPQTEKGVSTNSTGRFEIELPTGEYTFQLSYMGFEQSRRSIMLIESGNIELELFEETHNLAEVTVVGEEFNSSRTQMSMVKVESKEIKNLPQLMGEADIIKSITMLAGVQTVSELSSGINVRGGNTDQNLILVDGSPIFNTTHVFGFYSMINPDVVDDLRLYKGGLPVRYGERISSVMEVALKDGNSEAIKASGGLGVISSRLTIDGPLSKNKKLKILAGGRTSYSDWILKNIPDPDLSKSIANFYDISGKITYDFDAYNKLAFTVYSSNDEYSTSIQSVNKYNNLLGNIYLRTRYNDKLNSELDFSYSKYNFRLTDKANGKQSESYYLDNQIQYSSLKYHMIWHPNESQNINYGFNGVYFLSDPGEILPVYKESVIEGRKLEREKALEFAAYLSDEFKLTPDFTINFGVRYSRFLNFGPKTVYLYDENQSKSPGTVIGTLSFEDNEIVKSYGGLEPRISLNYDTPAGNTLKFSFQRVQQFVNQISNNAVISPAETWKISDYHLKPLISDQLAIGFTDNTLFRSINFTSEVYYKRLQNLIEYKNGAQLIMNSNLETSLISSDGYSYGIEVSLNKNTGRLTGSLNYTFSRTMRKTTGVFDEEQFWDGDYYPSIYDKPHDLSVVTTYNISRRWRLSGNFVLISGRPVTLPEAKYQYAGETLIYYSDRNKYRMPPYHRFDISLTFDENLKKKRMWKGSWTLSIYNLYGRKNPYSVYYRKTVSSRDTNYSNYSLFKLAVIGIPVPSLTYNFTF